MSAACCVGGSAAARGPAAVVVAPIDWAAVRMGCEGPPMVGSAAEGPID